MIASKKNLGIEVKAVTSGRMQSLYRFLEEDNRRLGLRVSQENNGIVGNIRVVPLYAAEVITKEKVL